jgi:YggT family protein
LLADFSFPPAGVKQVLDNILSIVLGAAYWVLVPAALLRFQMQRVRAPFRNPVGKFVCALTDWAVKPLRRVLPGRGGYDWASLAAAFAFELANSLLFDLLSLRMTILHGHVLPWLVAAPFGLVTAILTVMFWCLVAYALLSWVHAESPAGDILDALVNPWLRPIRRRLPLVGGFDLSPLVLMVLIQIALAVLVYARMAALGGVLRP